ncbi:4-hydroxythreonine-4-phosphate dehydrogenase PdxA [Candidatus Sumerlaeota bacterium]|nr:4-hydroxythreonine-4-phosphate dehydrogenase PdxA [Candidatus Sumerlaeota bacterium]
MLTENAHATKPESRLRIGLTMGDPSGVGPEIIAKALAQINRGNIAPVILGLEGCMRAAGMDASSLEALNSAEDLDVLPLDKAGLLTAGDPTLASKIEIGCVSTAGGAASLAAIELGIRLCLAGKLDALCTAPINKHAISLAGSKWPGHTEMLRDMTGVSQVAMTLVGGGLRTVPLTNHAPYAETPRLITHEAILEMLALLDRHARLFVKRQPRIGVAGLNPHAGDGGVLGREEIDVIEPAVVAARESGIDATGPVSGDAIFLQMLHGRFDIVLAMYHDQALIPVKTLDFDGGVNVTLGLPFIRTSPDHGTAHDIAGKDMARPESMIAAIQMACELTEAQRTMNQ